MRSLHIWQVTTITADLINGSQPLVSTAHCRSRVAGNARANTTNNGEKQENKARRRRKRELGRRKAGLLTNRVANHCVGSIRDQRSVQLHTQRAWGGGREQLRGAHANCRSDGMEQTRCQLKKASGFNKEHSGESVLHRIGRGSRGQVRSKHRWTETKKGEDNGQRGKGNRPCMPKDTARNGLNRIEYRGPFSMSHIANNIVSVWAMNTPSLPVVIQCLGPMPCSRPTLYKKEFTDGMNERIELIIRSGFLPYVFAMSLSSTSMASIHHLSAIACCVCMCIYLRVCVFAMHKLGKKKKKKRERERERDQKKKKKK